MLDHKIVRSYVLRVPESATIRERSFSSMPWSKSSFLKQDREIVLVLLFRVFVYVYIWYEITIFHKIVKKSVVSYVPC